MTKETKTWEEEFIEKFGIETKELGTSVQTEDPNEVFAFISSLFQKERERMLKIGEGMKKKTVSITANSSEEGARIHSTRTQVISDYQERIKKL